MTTATAKHTSNLHSVGRDLRHDWGGWSMWERRAVTVLGVTASAAGVFWLGMSVLLLS